MNVPDYRMLLTLVDAAKLLLAINAGALSPADLRIRSLLNITGQEAQRALLEMNASSRLASTDQGREGDNKEKAATPRARRTRADAVAAS